MAHFYIVPAIGDPAAEGRRPDVPAGVSWCGNTDGTTYLIRTVDAVSGLTELFAAEIHDVADWQAGEAVAVDDRRVYQEIVYRCIQAHTTQEGWEPPEVPALWTPAREDGDPWVEPTMAEDSYNTGDIVLHDGSLWSSQIDANTTEPGAQGHSRWWAEIPGVEDEAADLIAAGAAFAERDPLERWRIRGR